ncbi:MAG: hypothetical protein ACYTAN_00710 [Planctomycetota bacterium]|jgi:hypothetical protein
MKLVLPRGASKAAIVAASLAAALAVTWPALFCDSVGAFGDNLSFWAPSTAYWTSQVKDGQLPLWNPYILGGVPFAADVNHGLFYPPHWIAVWRGAAGSFGILAFLHVALAGVGMSLLLLHEDVPEPAAAAGGAIFALSTPFLSLINHIVMLESMSYLPFVILGASMLARKPGLAPAALAGAALALSALAGDVHATYTAALAGGLVLAARIAPALFSGGARRAGIAAGLFALSGVAAFLLAAAAVIPALEFFTQSVRAQGGMSYTAHLGLDPKGAVEVLFPNFWGSLRDGTAWNYRWHNAVYIGLPLLALAAYAARRAASRCGQILLVVVGVALALGEESPLWRLAFKFLPGFRAFRQPREYFIIAALGIIWLAASGLGDLMAKHTADRKLKPKAAPGSGKTRTALLIALGLVAVGAVLVIALDVPFALSLGRRLPVKGSTAQEIAGRAVILSVCFAVLFAALAALVLALRKSDSRGIACLAALAVIIACDTLLASARRVVWGPAELYQRRGAAAAAVRPTLHETSAARFAPVGPEFGKYFTKYASRRTNGIMPEEQASFETAAQVKECLVDNEPLYSEIPSALGYSTFLPKRYVRLYEVASEREVGSPVRPASSAETKWDLLGVGALLRFERSWHERSVERVKAPSAVFMAYQWLAAPDLASAVGLLAADREGALIRPVIEGLTGTEEGPAVAYAAHSIDDIRRSEHSLELLIHTDEPGVLVVMENNYPGWRVFDNGIEKKVLAANAAFRAIYLSRGKHQVKFVFESAPVYIGIIISGVAAVSLAVAVAMAAFRAWRR